MSNIELHNNTAAHKRAQQYISQLQLNNTNASSNTGIASASHKTLQRAVIVDGVRTPFVKSFGDLIDVDSIGLASSAVSGLVKKTQLSAQHIDGIIMGNVVVNAAAPNLAREVIIDTSLPRHIPGTTISIACLSGLEAIALATQQIELGDASVLIAGGSDSLSNGELTMPRKLTRALGKYSMGGGNKKGWQGYKDILNEAGPISTWFPQQNSIAERSTGKTMGYHADLMAEINQVSKQLQDEFAVRSHNNAYNAQQLGKFKNEIVPVMNGSGKTVNKDNILRPNMKIDNVQKLNPVFRTAAQHGTVSAASSSALTDGASAVLVMSESKARELGYPTDISIRAYVKTAIEPYPQLLMAPALAIPRCLDKAGLTLDDIDIFELHEAFAAQVLATVKVLADDDWCKKNLGKDKAVGKVPMEKLNINGGSLALGHPFAATGGRIVTSLAHELRRSKKRYGLISICAAGGIGGVAILERHDQ